MLWHLKKPFPQNSFFFFNCLKCMRWEGHHQKSSIDEFNGNPRRSLHNQPVTFKCMCGRDKNASYYHRTTHKADDSVRARAKFFPFCDAPQAPASVHNTCKDQYGIFDKHYVPRNTSRKFKSRIALTNCNNWQRETLRGAAQQASAHRQYTSQTRC